MEEGWTEGHYGASYDLKVGFGEGYESEPETGMDGVEKNKYSQRFWSIFLVQRKHLWCKKAGFVAENAKNQVAFQRKKCYNILLLIDMFMKNNVKYIH